MHFGGTPWVYDPQLALPAFAVAICIFTAMTAMFHYQNPDFLRPICTDLATFLEDNHQKATDGLVMVPIPNYVILVFMATVFAHMSGNGLYSLLFENGKSLPITIDEGASPAYSWWHGEIGAVDIYSIFGTSGYL